MSSRHLLGCPSLSCQGCPPGTCLGCPSELLGMSPRQLSGVLQLAVRDVLQALVGVSFSEQCAVGDVTQAVERGPSVSCRGCPPGICWGVLQ
jgi:hypothetical protein